MFWDKVNVPAPFFTTVVLPVMAEDWVTAPAALSVSVPPLRLTPRRVVIAPPALTVRPSAPTVEVTLAPVLNTMLFVALNVSDALPPADLAMALATVIFPA